MTGTAEFEKAVQELLNLTGRIYRNEELELAIKALEESLKDAPEGALAEACRNMVQLTKACYTGKQMEDAIAQVLRASNQR